MTLILASANEHKKRELDAILYPHTLLLPGHYNAGMKFEETGETFFENAYGKAYDLFRQTGVPVVADDSGLCIPALSGAPGVHSARYGATEPNQKLATKQRNEYLLEVMENIEQRNGFFVCCMVVIFEEYRYFVAQETLRGRITYAPVGTGGFGYDPLFFLDRYGKTVAELPAEEKDRISHRGKAGKRIKQLLDHLEQEGSDNNG